MNPLIRWSLAALLLLCFALPPFLALTAVLRTRKAKRPAAGWKATSPALIGLAVVTNWVLLVVYFASDPIRGVAANYQSYGLPALLLVFSLLLLIVSFAAYAGRWSLFTANVALLVMWFCFGYAPAHWLTRVDFGTVTVDNHAVPASVYFGHPTDSEAEAVVLVRLEGGGDYFLDFGSEKVREASRSEYVRLIGGVWCLRSMQTGSFVEPLPSSKLNEFQIRSRDGHLVTVQF